MGYMRYFMPMTSEMAGFEFKGRKSAGRVTVEAHNGAGKLTLWVQDVKPRVRYGVYLIFDDGQRYAGVYLCPLVVDEKGKANVRHEFDVKQLHGFRMQEVVAVAVMVADSPRVESPLCGYREKSVLWRGNYYEKKATAIKVEPKAEAEPEPQAKEALQPGAAEKIIGDEPPPDEIVMMPDEILSPTEPEPEWQDEPSPTPHEPPFPVASKPPSPPPPCADPSPLMEHLPNLRPISPFSYTSNADIRWMRFTMADGVPAPEDKPDLFAEPFVADSYTHYAHFILGEAIDGPHREYVIGVPGIYDETAQDRADVLGFAEFQCYEDTQPADGEFGYWLMYVG